jgi:MSHA biogenesis protein MshI
VLSWLGRKKELPGWFASTLDGELLDFAHAERASSGRWAITTYGSTPIGPAQRDLPKIAQDLGMQRYRCSTMLRPGEYQLLLIDGLNVPKAELKSALRWRVKDMIDYRIEEATIDLLDIPPLDGAADRPHPVFAVSARNELIKSRIEFFEAGRIPLSVIDIEETAQRNLAALYEKENRAVALAYFGYEAGLLTINVRGELYLARRLEVPLREIAADSTEIAEGAHERVALEIQRTLDHFDRQFRQVGVGKLLVAPTPQPTGLADFLRERFELPLEIADLRNALAFPGGAPDDETHWRLYHHFGAALRH